MFRSDPGFATAGDFGAASSVLASGTGFGSGSTAAFAGLLAALLALVRRTASMRLYYNNDNSQMYSKSTRLS
jgi:hypothetical protein